MASQDRAEGCLFVTLPVILRKYFSFVTDGQNLLSKRKVADMISTQSKLEVEFKTEPNGQNGSRTIEWVLGKPKGRKGSEAEKEVEKRNAFRCIIIKRTRTLKILKRR